MEDSDGNKVRYFVNVDAKNAEQEGEQAELRQLFRANDHPRECFTFEFNIEVRNETF